MRNSLRVVVFCFLLVPALVVAADTPRTAPGTGWWPEVMERTFSDALSFSREIMARVHFANQVATELGRLAEERAGSAELRRYGRLLAVDRRLQDAQIIDYASRRMGVPIGPPQFVMEAERELVQQRRARLDHLKTLTGLAFDDEFLALAWDDNQSTIELVDQARHQLDDPSLRIMFDQTMPILDQHEGIMRGLRSWAEYTSEER
jgi:predicted outer membrane protein